MERNTIDMVGQEPIFEFYRECMQATLCCATSDNSEAKNLDELFVFSRGVEQNRREYAKESCTLYE